MGSIEGGNNISEGNLEQQKQDIKSFLREVAEKSSNQILDSMIDNSDYKDLSEKQKKEKAIDAILKLGGDKYNYLKTGKALPLDLLERMVDEIEEVNQDTQNAINAIKSSRLEVKEEVSPDNIPSIQATVDNSIPPNKTTTIDKFGNKITYRPNQKNDQGLNNFIDSSVGSSVNFVSENGSNNLDNNKQEQLSKSFETQKTNILNTIITCKNEIQLLIKNSKEINDTYLIFDQDLLARELVKLDDFEKKIKSINTNEKDTNSIKQQETLYHEIQQGLMDTKYTISTQFDKLFGIVDFQKSTFVGGAKEIINGDIMDGLKQIGKTLVRINEKLIDSIEEYTDFYHTRLGMYETNLNGAMMPDGVGVFHYGKINGTEGEASVQDIVRHSGTTENFYNHERGQQYMFLIAEEAFLEAGLGKISSSILATVASAGLMYLREKMSDRLTPGDIQALTVIDLGNGNKLEASVTIAGSGHLKLDIKKPGEIIKGIDNYIESFKGEFLRNKGGGFKNGGVEKEANHQLYDDIIANMEFTLAGTGTTFKFNYNHNDVLSKEFGNNSDKYKFENFHAGVEQKIMPLKGENGQLYVEGGGGYYSSGGKSKESSYGNAGLGFDTSHNVGPLDLRVYGKGGIIQGEEGTDYYGKVGGEVTHKMDNGLKVGFDGGVSYNDIEEGKGVFTNGAKAQMFVENPSGLRGWLGVTRNQSGASPYEKIGDTGLVPGAGFSYTPKDK